MWFAATWKWLGWKRSRRELDSGRPVADRRPEFGGRGFGPKPQEVSGCCCRASVVLRKRPREASVSALSCS